MNKTIILLTLSDILVLTGFGLIQPILAIFIKENLVGGTIFAAGVASMTFIIVKSVVQIPLSKIVDRRKRSFRIKIVVLGTFLISIVPFIYILSNHVNFIYIAQILHGLGSGLSFPSWVGIWSKCSDISQRSYHWSLYSTLTGIGTGAAALIGASIAELFGFVYTFIIVGVMSLFGCFILLVLETKENPA